MNTNQDHPHADPYASGEGSRPVRRSALEAPPAGTKKIGADSALVNRYASLGDAHVGEDEEKARKVETTR